MGELPVFAVVEQGTTALHHARPGQPRQADPDRPPVLPGQLQVEPGTALPEALAVPERRALAASYITGQDNPWFAKAYINRIWYVLMGEAFYEPIDDIGPERDAQGPRGLEPPGRPVAEGRLRRPLALPHDPEHRGLSAPGPLDGQRGRQDPVRLELPQPAPRRPGLRSPGPGPGAPPGRQRQSSFPAATTAPPAAPGPGRHQAAARPLPTSQPAHQESRRESGRGRRAGLAGRQESRPPPCAPGGPRLLFDRLFGVDPSVANEDVMGTIPQALFLMNSPLVNNRIQARPGTVLGEILSSRPERPRGPGRPLPPRPLPPAHEQKKSRSAAGTWPPSATARGVRRHLLEPDQLDRVPHPALNQPETRARNRSNREAGPWLSKKKRCRWR